MPVYTFRCPAGHTFDKLRPISKFSRSALCSAHGRKAHLVQGGAPVVRFRDAKYGHFKRYWTHPTRPVSQDPSY